MNIKKIMSLVVVVAMIMTVVPAFGLVAGAAEPETDVLALIADADYAFVGEVTPPAGSTGIIGWDDARLVGTNWEGFSGAEQLYWASGDWIGIPNALFIDGNANSGVMNVSQAVKDGSLDKDYIVISWSASTVDSWTDFKMIDADESAFDTFRYRSCHDEGLNYEWAGKGWQSHFAGVCEDYEYEDNAAAPNGIAAARTVYYMVYANNKDAEGYTASYYYKAAEDEFATWIGTKTFAAGSVNGLSGIEFGTGEGAQRMFDFSVYAGSTSEIVSVEGTQYKVLSDNLITNGDFTDGFNGWYKASDGSVYEGTISDNAEYINGEGYAITNTASAGGSGASTIRRFVPIEAGKTYYLSFYGYNTGDTFGHSNNGGMSAFVPAKGIDIYGSFNGITFKDYLEYGGQNSWSNEPQSEVKVNRDDMYYESGMNHKEFIYTIPEDSDAESLFINAFAWTGVGRLYFSDFQLYEVEVYELPTTIEVTYTVNGEAVDSLTARKVVEKGATASFDEKVYSPDGGNNLYIAEALTDIAESITVEMTAVVNADVNGYAKGSSVTVADKKYNVVSDNLVPNGNFGYGVTGWYNGTDTAATSTVNGDGTVTMADGGGGSAAALYRSWAIEPQKTYVFTYTSNTSNGYHKVALTNVMGANTNNEAKDLTNDLQGTNYIVFTNTDDYAYIRMNFRWSNNNVVGNFGLYEIEEDTAAAKVSVAVNYVDEEGNVLKVGTPVEYYEGTAVATVAANEGFYLKDDNGAAYIVSTEDKTYTTEDAVDGIVAVKVTIVHKYAVLEDALVSDNEIWGINKANDNSVFVAGGDDANRGPLTDADGVAVTDGSHTPSTLGKSRVGFLQFPVVDLAEGQAAVAKFYVRTWHDNTFSNGNTSIRIAATAINDDSWTALTDGNNYDSVNAPVFEGYTNTMFSAPNARTEWLSIDVTEAMKAAKEAGLSTITLRLNTAWGAAYIAECEKAVAGGLYEGKAAYIDVVDGVNVTVNGAAEGALITKNGVKMNSTEFVAVEGDVVRVYAGADAASGVVATANNGDIATAATIGDSDTTLVVVSNVEFATTPVVRYNYETKSYELIFEAEAKTEGAIASYGFDYDAAQLADGVYANLETLANNAQADGAQAIFRLAITGINGADAIRLYGVKPYIVLESGVKVVGELATASLLDAIADEFAACTDETIVAEKIDAVNALLPVIVSEGVLTNAKHPDYAVAASKLLTIADGVVTVNEAAAKFGVGFTATTKFIVDGAAVAVEVAEDEAEDAVVFATVTIADGKAVLSGGSAAPADVEVIALDAVQLDFVPEAVGEDVANGFDIEYDVEELI